MTVTPPRTRYPFSRSQSTSLVVIGASAGGLDALSIVLKKINISAPFAIACVLHLPPDRPSILAELLKESCQLRVKEAESTEMIQAGTFYLAPPGYHLCVEPDQSLSLSTEEPVNFSRPSIDMLFRSASEVYKESLVGILLTGANHDGAQGLARIQHFGGRCLVQDPATALYREMPSAALALIEPDRIASLDEIGDYLAELSRTGRNLKLEV